MVVRVQMTKAWIWDKSWLKEGHREALIPKGPKHIWGSDWGQWGHRVWVYPVWVYPLLPNDASMLFPFASFSTRPWVVVLFPALRRPTVGSFLQEWGAPSQALQQTSSYTSTVGLCLNLGKTVGPSDGLRLINISTPCKVHLPKWCIP